MKKLHGSAMDDPLPDGKMVARIRRLRGSAIISADDIAVYSALLKQELPQLVYFFANYKTGVPTPDKFAEDVPIVVHDSLDEAVRMALELEKKRPDYNGPNFNRPDVMARWPLASEAKSGDAERLIGGRKFPDMTRDISAEYRELGRWFLFQYRSKGYRHPSPSDADCDRYQMLDATQSEFFTLYDLSDSETKSFAHRAFALWRRLSTKRIGHYDPATRDFVEPQGWDGKYPWSVGKRALMGALETPPRYAGFAPRTGPDGRLLMLGPAPTRRPQDT